MADSITTIDAEQFKNSVFLTLSLKGLSFKRQVKDQNKIAAYFAQVKTEADLRRSQGIDVDLSHVAIAGMSGSGMPKAGKALTSTKTLLFSPALDALRQHLTDTKAAITAPPQYGG